MKKKIAKIVLSNGIEIKDIGEFSEIVKEFMSENNIENIDFDDPTILEALTKKLLNTSVHYS